MLVTHHLYTCSVYINTGGVTMEDMYSLSHSYIEYYTSCIYIDTCRVLCFLYMDIYNYESCIALLFVWPCLLLSSFILISHKHVLVIIDKIIKYLFKKNQLTHYSPVLPINPLLFPVLPINPLLTSTAN